MITFEDVLTFHEIVGVYVTGLMAFLGTVFNVINIVVFVKLGFSDTTNISLLALALSDIGVFLTMVVYSLTNLPIVSSLMGQSLTIANNTIEGSVQIMFCRISGLITAYLALERFVCVAWPLRVRTFITPRLTICVTTGIFVLMTLCNVPLSLTKQIVMSFDPLLNVTVYEILPDPKNDFMSDITLAVQVVTQMTSFAVVIMSTLGLIRSLRQSVRWRKSVLSAGRSSRGSRKEKQLVKMVILISAVFIVCSLPAVVGNLATIFSKDFNQRGRHRNLFFVMCNIFVVFNFINAIINIFVYANMSSRFREKLFMLLKRFGG